MKLMLLSCLLVGTVFSLKSIIVINNTTEAVFVEEFDKQNNPDDKLLKLGPQDWHVTSDMCRRISIIIYDGQFEWIAFPFQGVAALPFINLIPETVITFFEENGLITFKLA